MATLTSRLTPFTRRMSGRTPRHLTALVVLFVAGISSAAAGQTLPAGWHSTDIGTPVVAGSASFSGGVFSVAAGRVYSLTASDRLTFAYLEVTGDSVLTARVTSLAAAGAGAGAGVLIRESLASGSKQAAVMLTDAGTVAMTARTVTNGSRGIVSESAAAAPVWLRLRRTASTFQAFRSTDGIAWTPIGTVTIPMTATVYAGVAVAEGIITLPIASTTARFDNVNQTFDNVNQPPTVSLTSPAAGATYPAPAMITLSASASDADGAITTVEFYSGTTLIASDMTSPYSVTWSDVPAGNYDLTAVARDDSNGMTVSGARTITVTDSPLSTTAIFNASSDDNVVDYYVVEIFPEGADPTTANAIAAQNVGKPPLVNGESQADIGSMIQALSPGRYIGTVTAFNSSGSARSAPSPAFAR